MPELIIVNDPAGVGKTSICQHLTQKAPESINVSGDAIRQFAPSDVRNHLGPGSTYRAASSLMQDQALA